MENLKRLLLQCELCLEQGDLDRLLELLGSIKEEDFKALDLQEAQECMRILEHMISRGEALRNSMAESLINLKRFKEGYRF